METAKSSGFQTASGIVCANRCLITGVQLYTNGDDESTLIIYDNPSAGSGKALFKGRAVATANSDVSYVTKDFSFPVLAQQGLYATVTGTAAEYCVEYIEG